MNNPVWERAKYTAPIDFIIGNTIREYDISKANISILRDMNIISEEEYSRYYNLPKDQREREIGILSIRSQRVKNAISQGLVEAKRLFIMNNLLVESDILAIKGDAIFVIGNKTMNTQIGNHIRFRLSNEYTSFYKLTPFIEIYYSYIPYKDIEIFDAKGMEKSLYLHQSYMMNYLCSLFYIAQTVGIEEAIKSLKDFYMKYIFKELPIEYYRRFDSNSNYDILSFPGQMSTTCFKGDIWNDVNTVDISYNESILRTLQRMYTVAYFNMI